jgi:hypothetical protein
MVQVINETQADLKKLIELDFGPLPVSAKFDRALLDWLHYRARIIPRRPRHVVRSSSIQAHAAHYPAITKIETALRAGGDLSPWLSDRVDTRKTDPCADLMFNDWQISHFHLAQVFATPKKIRRTRDLLFCYITAEQAVLLDVAPHGSWALRQLLRVLVHTEPQAMRALNGVTGMERQVTDEEYRRLREAGGNVLFEIEGKVYASPGMGIMSSRHAERIVLFADHLQMSIKMLSGDIQKNTLPIGLSRTILSNIALPVRLGVLMVAGEFVVYDKNRSLGLMQLGCIA